LKKRANWTLCLNSKDILSQFQKQKNLIYLNAGSVGLSPTSVIEKVAQEKTEQELNPTKALFGAWVRMWETQKKVGQFFNCDPKHLFLRPNVTYVMNDFIMALNLPKASEILISDLEYGAIVKICEEKARLEGHTVRGISLYPKDLPAASVTEDMLLERLEREIKPNTKLVVFSHIMTGNGLTIPAEKIGQLLRSKNIIFACDGAHGTGAMPLSFKNSAIDFYGTNMHKWMMGPKGTAFGYLAPQVREHLTPRFAGWTTGEVAPHFALFGEGDLWTSRWMINSTVNFSDFYGIDALLDWWNGCGPQTLFTKRQELFNFLLKETESLPWKCLSNFQGTLRGPLCAFDLPDALSQKQFGLMAYLFKEHSMVISMTIIHGRWCLRVSPHVYNSEDEISRAVKVFHSLKSVF
jgi:isopenicillin-N epimerase